MGSPIELRIFAMIVSFCGAIGAGIMHVMFNEVPAARKSRLAID